MLVFFIHGVNTRKVDYPKDLQKNILSILGARKQQPLFYASSWSNVHIPTGLLWNDIRSDIQKLGTEKEIENTFRYQNIRENLITDFFGDFLAYFNPERGARIRQVVVEQFTDFIVSNPDHKEIHIVAHSLGSIVLWDLLFSERLDDDDPIHDFRELIAGYGKSVQIKLSSITTMGAPLAFFRIMIDVFPERLNKLIKNDIYVDSNLECDVQNNVSSVLPLLIKGSRNPASNIASLVFKKSNYPILKMGRNRDSQLRWINLIHSSDSIAYPISSLLCNDKMQNLFARDKFIAQDANLAEKGARTAKQEMAAMAVSISDAHSFYWTSKRVAWAISANLCGDCNAIDSIPSSMPSM